MRLRLAIIWLAATTTAFALDVEVEGRVLRDAAVLKEYPKSILIRHREGAEFIDRAKLSDTNLSLLTGQSIITPDERVAPVARPQANPFDPPKPRIYETCSHVFAGPRRPSDGMFRGFPTGREDVPSTSEVIEHEVYRRVNEERKAQGRAPLKWNEDLARAARYHAADMCDGGYFEHDTHDRVAAANGVVLKRVGRPDKRIRAFWPAYGGENIAKGQPTPRDVMRCWMSSSGHRANILASDFTSIGVGFVHGVWVQDFGRDAKKDGS